MMVDIFSTTKGKEGTEGRKDGRQERKEGRKAGKEGRNESRKGRKGRKENKAGKAGKEGRQEGRQAGRKEVWCLTLEGNISESSKTKNVLPLFVNSFLSRSKICGFPFVMCRCTHL